MLTNASRGVRIIVCSSAQPIVGRFPADQPLTFANACAIPVQPVLGIFAGVDHLFYTWLFVAIHRCFSLYSNLHVVSPTSSCISFCTVSFRIMYFGNLHFNSMKSSHLSFNAVTFSSDTWWTVSTHWYLHAYHSARELHWHAKANAALVLTNSGLLVVPKITLHLSLQSLVFSLLRCWTCSLSWDLSLCCF